MLEGRTYVPLLHARLAEMRALRELPVSSKNLLLPIIKIRPWLNALALEKVYDVIDAAFSQRAYGFDLDQVKRDVRDPRTSYVEFTNLFSQADSYRAYYDAVSNRAHAIPVLRELSGDLQDVIGQLEHVQRLDRGLIVRVDVNRPGHYLQLATACLERTITNVIFIFDCGWSEDVLLRASSCTNLVESLMDVNEDFEVVIAGSSFPETFSDRGQKFSLRINERVLFQEVRRNTNRGRLFYGDWASTRPPSDPTPMRSRPRIDVAHRADWTCWRSNGQQDFAELAREVLADDNEIMTSGLWGDYMIASTAQGIDPSIKSAVMAAAVRVNLHLYTQANFDEPSPSAIPDEPVGDDL